MPNRIQLRRSRGWRMPPDTVKVDRSTIFGNPWVMTPTRSRGEAVAEHRRWILGEISDAELAARYGPDEGKRLAERRRIVCERIPELKGKNLACWCPEGSPCHVDTLLQLANA
jgi:hypothetical protein